MSTLRKFKVLAMQCAVSAASPTTSPSASPVPHLRRRRSLRKLLRRHHTPPTPSSVSGAAVSPKLKDFLLSSPPPPPRKLEERVRVLPHAMPRVSRGLDVTRGGGRGVTTTLRQRLMRKSWRPVLGSIPE